MARGSKPPPGGAQRDDAAPEADAGMDAILDELEAIVRELEAGDLPLERALERFESGVRLARKGGRVLDEAEAKVERLLADRDETVPLSPEAERQMEEEP